MGQFVVKIIVPQTQTTHTNIIHPTSFPQPYITEIQIYSKNNIPYITQIVLSQNLVEIKLEICWQLFLFHQSIIKNMVI